jgi:hypothetical protein
MTHEKIDKPATARRLYLTFKEEKTYREQKRRFGFQDSKSGKAASGSPKTVKAIFGRV